MNEPWDWDESDLQMLIANQVRESIELDYKACDALQKTDGKKNELSKDVSAFANSAGGTIVYGMIENGHVPTAIDAGYDPSEISKEWIEQVINSRIQRRIDGVRIKQVDLTASSLGRVAYVISIPQSLRAPHQASDKRFYKRFNFESVSMEEYEVRDVSSRYEAPKLILAIHASIDASPRTRNITHPANLLLTLSITNLSDVPADHIVANIVIDGRLGLVAPSGMKVLANVKREIDGAEIDCHQLALNWSVPPNMPVFKGVWFDLMRSGLQFTIPNGGTYLVEWNLHSPKMQIQNQRLQVSWDGSATSRAKHQLESESTSSG